MKNRLRNLRIPILILLLVLTAAAFNVLMVIEINGSSMFPTLESNDRVIANTLHHIERFDIIVFRNEKDSPVVKRVIGLPGETIYYEEDQLFVNHTPVAEPFLDEVSSRTDIGIWTSDFHLEEVIEESTIPSNSYFVLGDNRRLSYDSRVYGVVPEEAVLGEVVMIVYPFDRITFTPR